MHPPARWLSLCVLAATARLASASELAVFARCISRAGATFYTASWCPHCAEQVRRFGDGISYVHSVDCTAGCTGIKSFPTWTFKDGSRLSGVASFDVLASHTGCSLPNPPRDADGPGSHERYLGGAKIIEIPHR